MMGGTQLSGDGPADLGYDEDGYDESQRAEILEATTQGPGDGTVLTDLAPDLSIDDIEGDDDDLDDDTDDDADFEDDDEDDDDEDLDPETAPDDDEDDD
jgi:DNA-directed RNA polymerase subunit delta